MILMDQNQQHQQHQQPQPGSSKSMTTEECTVSSHISRDQWPIAAELARQLVNRRRSPAKIAAVADNSKPLLTVAFKGSSDTDHLLPPPPTAPRISIAGLTPTSLAGISVDTVPTLQPLRQEKLSGVGNKPYKCGDCGAQFQYRRNLHVHTKIRHDGQRYNCPKCPLSYTRLGNLRSHHRSTHSTCRSALSCASASTETTIDGATVDASSRSDDLDIDCEIDRPGVRAHRAQPELITASSSFSFRDPPLTGETVKKEPKLSPLMSSLPSASPVYPTSTTAAGTTTTNPPTNQLDPLLLSLLSSGSMLQSSLSASLLPQPNHHVAPAPSLPFVLPHQRPQLSTKIDVSSMSFLHRHDPCQSEPMALARAGAGQSLVLPTLLDEYSAPQQVQPGHTTTISQSNRLGLPPHVTTRLDEPVNPSSNNGDVGACCLCPFETSDAALLARHFRAHLTQLQTTNNSTAATPPLQTNCNKRLSF